MPSDKEFKCPFYGSHKKKKRLTCEGGTGITFPDHTAAERYFCLYCTSGKGWESCSIAEMLNEYYERKYER